MYRNMSHPGRLPLPPPLAHRPKSMVSEFWGSHTIHTVVPGRPGNNLKCRYIEDHVTIFCRFIILNSFIGYIGYTVSATDLRYKTIWGSQLKKCREALANYIPTTPTRQVVWVCILLSTFRYIFRVIGHIMWSSDRLQAGRAILETMRTLLFNYNNIILLFYYI